MRLVKELIRGWLIGFGCIFAFVPVLLVTMGPMYVVSLFVGGWAFGIIVVTWVTFLGCLLFAVLYQCEKAPLTELEGAGGE